MASESTPPPPPSGGGARYALIGIALAMVAGAAWCLTSPDAGPGPTAATLPDAGPPVARSTALVDDSLEIPDPEPDAGPPPDAGVVAAPETPRRPSGGGGDWECSGDLDAAAIRPVVAEYNPQIRSCYERRLKANPLLTGNMSLQIKVRADGTVDGVQISGSLRDREVFSCVRSVAMRMRFPRVTGGSCAIVAVPYSFTPEN